MIVIALGANLPSRAGAPRDTLLAALDELSGGGIRVVAVSPFYRTEAWPDPGDPAFVNAVAMLETELAPDALMARLEEVERSFGRRPAARNAPRPLDLDLIDYNGRVQGEGPVLPHPRVEQRGFVLVPLAEVAPGWRHPVSGKSVGQLIAALPGGARDVALLEA